MFIKTLGTGAIRRVSTGRAGRQASDSSFGGDFSPDGSRIAFASDADNLVPGDTNGRSDLFVKTMRTGEVRRISTNASGGQANANSTDPAFSPDGTRIAFSSDASNLVPRDTNHATDIFVKQVTGKAIIRVSTTDSGGQANGDSTDASWSCDGRRIGFASWASNLEPRDTNVQTDIFVKSADGTKRVSVSGRGAQGNGRNSFPDFAPRNPHLIVYLSTATNLVAGDRGPVQDVYLAND